MARFPFLVGPAYTSWSTNAENQECINFFQELVETGQGKSGYVLNGTPGLEVVVELPTGPIRALFTVPFSFPTPDRNFAVGGAVLYEIFTATGTFTALGTVGNDGYPVYIASNGKQLAIVSAQSLYGFQLEANADPVIAAGTFTGPIANEDGELLTLASVDFLGGYFVAPVISAEVRGKQVYSDLYNVNSWPTLNFFTAEDNPDRCTRGIVDHGEYWCFGDASVQVFGLMADPDNPFQSLHGSAIPQGTSSPAAVVKQDNTVFWLSVDPEKGGPIFSRADGWLARRVSNHSVEAYLAKLSKETIGKAVSYAFTMNGHPFIQLSFPGDRVTWRYDASIQDPSMAWHKVGCWNPRTGSYDAHRTLTHTYGSGMHLVGNR